MWVTPVYALLLVIVVAGSAAAGRQAPPTVGGPSPGGRGAGADLVRERVKFNFTAEGGALAYFGEQRLARIKAAAGVRGSLAHLARELDNDDDLVSLFIDALLNWPT
jgi:hypothetical protein